MLSATLAALDVRQEGCYIDATVGLGGHAEAILEAAPGGRLLGVDADPVAVLRARERLLRYGSRAVIVQGNFRDLHSIALSENFSAVDGILFDLGVSSLQLGPEGRGFSFQHEAPLDMRIDPGLLRTAADLVNDLSEHDLAELLHAYGEEPLARRISRAIVRKRPFTLTTDLARAVSSAVGRPRSRTHPATRTFQALRIAVNAELESLSAALSAAAALLRSGGRIVVISFHSLEDRVVKEFLRREVRDCVCPPTLPVCACSHRATLRTARRSALKPAEPELAANPRSRSARLRVAERI